MVGAVVLGDGTKAVYYADRAMIADRFGPPSVLADVPWSQDLFMTEDCGRMYFPGLGNVLYEAQP